MELYIQMLFDPQNSGSEEIGIVFNNTSLTPQRLKDFFLCILLEGISRVSTGTPVLWI